MRRFVFFAVPLLYVFVPSLGAQQAEPVTTQAASAQSASASSEIVYAASLDRAGPLIPSILPLVHEACLHKYNRWHPYSRISRQSLPGVMKETSYFS